MTERRRGVPPEAYAKKELYQPAEAPQPQANAPSFDYSEFAPDGTPESEQRAAVEQGNAELKKQINQERERRALLSRPLSDDESSMTSMEKAMARGMRLRTTEEERAETVRRNKALQEPMSPAQIPRELARELGREKRHTNKAQEKSKEEQAAIRSGIRIEERSRALREARAAADTPAIEEVEPQLEVDHDAPELEEAEPVIEAKEAIETAKKSWLGSFVESARNISGAAGKLTAAALIEAGGKVTQSVIKDLQEAKRMLVESSLGQYIAEDLKTLRHAAFGEKGSGYVRVDTDPDQPAPKNLDDWFNNIPGDWVEDKGRPGAVGEAMNAARDLAEGAKYVLTGGFTKEILAGIMNATRSEKKDNKEVLEDLLHAAQSKKRSKEEKIAAENKEILADLLKAARNKPERNKRKKEAFEDLLSEAKMKEAEKLAKELEAQSEGFKKRIEHPDDTVSEEQELAEWREEKQRRRNEPATNELTESVLSTSRDVVGVFRYVKSEIKEVGHRLETVGYQETPDILDAAVERVNQGQQELAENAIAAMVQEYHVAENVESARRELERKIAQKRFDIAHRKIDQKKKGARPEKKQAITDILQTQEALLRELYQAYEQQKEIDNLLAQDIREEDMEVIQPVQQSRKNRNVA